MDLIGKKDTAFEFLRSNANKFVCPICRAPLCVREPFFSCEAGHDFSVPRKGVPVLMKTQLKKSRIYDKELFENRRAFVSGGYYGEVYQKIAELAHKYCASPKTVLDIGCGEGSHTKFIGEALSEATSIIGFDISRDAIELASDFLSHRMFFFVGDATRMPLADKSIDIMIDFLSPYHSGEARRALKDDGLFIKIAPCEGYLCELREALKIDSYNGADAVQRAAAEHFHQMETVRITHTADLSSDDSEAALKMSPLTKGKAILLTEIKQVTIDLSVTCYKKQGEAI